MPRSDWQLRLRDILQAIDKIESFTAGMTLEAFSADVRTVDAVLYNIIVIGEAARRIPPEVEQRHPRVPWSEMRGIRNVIVHEYHRVSLPLVWQTTRHNLPPLATLLQDVLSRES